MFRFSVSMVMVVSFLVGVAYKRRKRHEPRLDGALEEIELRTPQNDVMSDKRKKAGSAFGVQPRYRRRHEPLTRRNLRLRRRLSRGLASLCAGRSAERR